MNKLDKEEQDILEAFESGKLKRVKNVKDQIEKHKFVDGQLIEKTS